MFKYKTRIITNGPRIIMNNNYMINYMVNYMEIIC